LAGNLANEESFVGRTIQKRQNSTSGLAKEQIPDGCERRSHFENNCTQNEYRLASDKKSIQQDTPLRRENFDHASDPNFLVVGREVSECRPAFGLDFRFSGDSLGLHYGLDFIKMPRAKLVCINASIKRECQRLVQ
jgi:hypothetical protein